MGSVQSIRNDNGQFGFPVSRSAEISFLLPEVVLRICRPENVVWNHPYTAVNVDLRHAVNSPTTSFISAHNSTVPQIIYICSPIVGSVSFLLLEFKMSTALQPLINTSTNPMLWRSASLVLRFIAQTMRFSSNFVPLTVRFSGKPGQSLGLVERENQAKSISRKSKAEFLPLTPKLNSNLDRWSDFF